MLLVAIVVIAAAVGGGVGVTLAKKGPSTEILSVEGSSAPADSPSSAPANLTNLALASWRSTTDEKDMNVQLFYQGSSGELRERKWTSASGWSPDSLLIGDTPIIARENSPIAQATWVTIGGAREIRLFYLNADNIICDAVYSSGKWINGSLEAEKFRAGENAKLGATIWNMNTEVWVCFQNSNDELQQLSWKNGIWTLTTDGLMTTAKGAGLGTLYWVDSTGDPQLRVYTQTKDHAIISLDFAKGKWKKPNPLYNSTTTPLGTSITATMVNTGGEHKGLAMVRVYFVGERGIVREINWSTEANAWNQDPRNLVEGQVGGSVAAVDWNLHDARMIYEKREGGLGEMVLSGESTTWNATDFSL